MTTITKKKEPTFTGRPRAYARRISPRQTGKRDPLSRTGTPPTTMAMLEKSEQGFKENGARRKKLGEM